MTPGLRAIIGPVLIMLIVLLQMPGAHAQQNPQQVRKFNDVLSDLLNEFSYDLKTNQLRVSQTVSVRKVSVSEPIPRSYEGYLENLILERLRSHSKIKVIQCSPCRTRKSIIENGRVTVSAPINNPQELESLASQLGIESWLDVSLIYQETQMILSLSSFDSRTKELLWTKNYNSEKAPQKSPQKPGDEIPLTKDEDGKYIPSYVFQLGVGGALVPNVNTSSQMLQFSLRIAEKFNQNSSEIGAMIAGVLSPDLITKSYASSGAPTTTQSNTITSLKDLTPFQYGLELLACYHHNFFKGQENYDAFRYGAHVGVGSLFASGYLTVLTRTGALMRFGRRFVAEIGVAYASPTTIKIDAVKLKTTGGVGADATFGLLF